MADIEYSHTMGGYGHRPEADEDNVSPVETLASLTHVAGALVSLALIAGIGVWGYKLMVRDVSGIPVVRAAEGEMRVRPDDPGGQLARHQGLAVNSVAAQGFASGPVDQVVLAPRPAALAEEDQPVANVAPVTAPAPLKPAAEAFSAPAEPVLPDTDDPVATAASDSVAEDTQALQPAETLSGTGTDAAVLLAAAEAESVPVPQNAVAEEPGLKVSARPRLRPSGGATIQNVAYTAATPSSEIDPAKIPSGTRLAQLGAFDSPDVARSEWTRLEGRFGDYLEGKSRVVQQAQSGGRTFYRLRAMGFRDLNDSRRFCAAFKAEGVDCIPVASK